MLLWDTRKRIQSGQPLIANPNQGRVFGVAFSPDGHTLAAVGDDAAVRLWNTRTHTQLGQPLGPEDNENSAYGVAFSPDGRTLASARGSGSVRVWNDLLWNDRDELTAKVCGLVFCNITQGEWDAVASGLAYRTTCPSQ